MRKISQVRVLPGYRLDLEFDDGVSGTVDLSEKVGQGVFALWRDPLAFERVRSVHPANWSGTTGLICARMLSTSRSRERSRKTFFPRCATKPPMPEISRFFGIVIKMFFDDHNPPHFHAEYGNDLALIDIPLE